MTLVLPMHRAGNEGQRKKTTRGVRKSLSTVAVVVKFNNAIIEAIRFHVGKRLHALSAYFRCILSHFLCLGEGINVNVLCPRQLLALQIV